ncbi:MAG: hypothetical protein V3S00_06540 [Dehalococcoidia bacterium]
MGGKQARRGSRKEPRPGFYSRVLDEAERMELQVALEVEGLDEEIALLRWKLRSLLEKEPEDIKLLLQAVNTLARLVKSRYNLSRDEDVTLKDTILTVLKELAVPLGVKVGAGFL